jgi:hypothetical protein
MSTEERRVLVVIALEKGNLFLASADSLLPHWTSLLLARSPFRPPVAIVSGVRDSVNCKNDLSTHGSYAWSGVGARHAPSELAWSAQGGHRAGRPVNSQARTPALRGFMGGVHFVLVCSTLLLGSDEACGVGLGVRRSVWRPDAEEMLIEEADGVEAG